RSTRYFFFTAARRLFGTPASRRLARRRPACVCSPAKKVRCEVRGANEGSRRGSAMALLHSYLEPRTSNLTGGGTPPGQPPRRRRSTRYFFFSAARRPLACAL